MSIFFNNNNMEPIKEWLFFSIPQSVYDNLCSIVDDSRIDELIRYLFGCLNFYYLGENERIDYVNSNGKISSELFNIEWSSPILSSFFKSQKVSDMADDVTAEILYGFGQIAENFTDRRCFINFIKGKETLSIEVLYNINDINSEEMSAYIKRFLELLEIFVNRPDIRLYEVIFDTKDLYQYNKGLINDKSIIDVLIDVKRKYANNIALMDEHVKYTYSEFEDITNQFANYLRENYLLKKKRIAIYMERSVYYVISILAIMKLGCAYVPLNKKMPNDRLNYIIEACNPDLIITDMQQFLIDTRCEKYVFNMQDFSKSPKSMQYLCTKDDIAYIIFTSGTTGKPKGVMITQSNVVNMRRHFKEDLGIKSDDVIGQFASFSFDASVSEMFMALFSGATLFVIKDEVIASFTRFEKCLSKNSISVITLPPDYSRCLDFARINGLRLVLTAGSECNIDLFHTLSTHFQVVNAYGPTECTVCATTWHGKVHDFIYHNIPIGKPIPDVRIYICNKWGNLMPHFIQGEICIGGNSVGKGYLNDQETSERKYINDVLFPEEKMYLTGDYGRMLPDGNIEFLGRKDGQYKINGIRIDVSEINAALLSIDDVINAYTTVIDKGKISLCSYYVTNNDALTVTELRKILKRKIPSYCIPETLIRTDEIRLNVNGKVDKGKISVVETTQKNIARTEKYVFEHIFERELLNKDIDLESSYYEIGGTSFAAIKIITELEKEYKVSLLISDFFSDVTMGTLFNRISEKISLQGVTEYDTNIS